MMLLLAAALALQSSPSGETTLQRLEREVAALVEKVTPSVVQVTSVFSAAPPDVLESLTFSGVIYSTEGHIVTDATGVERALEIRVRCGDRQWTARLLGADRRTGVAVLKVDASGLTPAVFAGGSPRAGAPAVAIGNALGLCGSAAMGTIAGAGRAIRVNGRRYEDMIQVALALQPGDCGGALADAQGRLVGILHSALGAVDDRLRDPLPIQGREAGAPAAGFAIPAEWVRFSADRIVKHGRMVRGWMGWSARPLDADRRRRAGVADGVGIQVVRVDPDGPAGKSGIAPGDVVVEFDGEPVTGLDALRWAVARVESPRRAAVALVRDGERRSVDVLIEIDPQR